MDNPEQTPFDQELASTLRRGRSVSVAGFADRVVVAVRADRRRRNIIRFSSALAATAAGHTGIQHDAAICGLLFSRKYQGLDGALQRHSQVLRHIGTGAFAGCGGLFQRLRRSGPGMLGRVMSLWGLIVRAMPASGALVFGGGHVILPLLEREVVAPGWLTPDQFLAGYGAAQALPGPLFTLSAYLGAVMDHGPGGAAGGGWALLAIFLPALLLVAGALPFWSALRHQPAAQAALRGANATVVGVLLAALWHPVGTAGIVDLATLVVAVGGFVALLSGKIPAWAVVLAAAGAGAIWF